MDSQIIISKREGAVSLNRIILKADKKFHGSVKELKDLFERQVEDPNREIRFANSEASILWIIRGCINYFDTLPPDFLGCGNASGIPSDKADAFANNVYRLNNAMKYLSELWKLDYASGSAFKVLIDLRTLIVHSGERINNTLSPELDEYRDIQLGRIFKRGENGASDVCSFQGETSDMDYVIQIWGDKQSKVPQNQRAVVDFYVQNESYIDIELFLTSADVRGIVLNQLNDFISRIPSVIADVQVRKSPPIGYLMRDESINFEKIASLLSKDSRGNYFIENGEHHWKGYGLQRLWNYMAVRTDISSEVKTAIENLIKRRIEVYWECYQDPTKTQYELPSLDIRDVLSEYTPIYDKKSYLEGEKLFLKIAPYFNVREKSDKTDIDYLGQFIGEASAALGVELNLEQSVDGLVCDYFVESVKMKLTD